VIGKVEDIIQGGVLRSDPVRRQEGAPGLPCFKISEPLQAEVQDVDLVLLSQNIEDEIEPIGDGMPDPVRGWNHQYPHFILRLRPLLCTSSYSAPIKDWALLGLLAAHHFIYFMKS